MHIPFLNLNGQHQPIKQELLAATEEVLDSSAFASGPYVEAFEADFARYCQTDFAVGVGSGTEALWLTLLAYGIGPGDEVITVPNTFVATAEAVSFAGAIPRFVDIEEQTYNMDPSLLEAAITPQTKVIIPVHLYGQMADMDPIREIAGKHGLYIIEDASQVHGARYKGRPAGSVGDAGCFSFYPGKNLGALGEAGAITTSDNELATRIRCLRDHGQAKKYYHDWIGWNARMDGIQAATLRVKLGHLPMYTKTRCQYAAIYDAYFREIEAIATPTEAAGRKHVYHLYPIRVSDRDAVREELQQRGITCGIHYPIPLHLQPAYWHLGYLEGSFPVAERCAKELLSLPMCPGLTEDQIKIAARAVREVVTARKAGEERLNDELDKSHELLG